MRQYILNEAGEPEACGDTLRWAKWFETGNRRVAQDYVGDVRVSTVFLGMDHAFDGGPPLLWETLVFGGPLDGDGDRYATRAEAEAGHAEWVARVRAAMQ